MKTQFIIIDKTENTGKSYIGEMDQNCAFEDQAMTFESKFEAETYISFKGWESWARVKEK